ncbi:MAG: hypothetical protein KAU50_10450, partial [Candidatus Marinimicrobia bacterium]|nr:hypothetical protein [Candidatus Neomarinimicrobiota bacterium]
MQPDYKKYFVLLIAIILLPYSLPAQQAVTVDLAYFRGAGNRSRVEVYLGIDRSSLNYKDLRRQKVADLAAVILVQEKGIVTAFREIPIRDIVAEPIGAVICQTDFELLPGHYDVKLAV